MVLRWRFSGNILPGLEATWIILIASGNLLSIPDETPLFLNFQYQIDSQEPNCEHDKAAILIGKWRYKSYPLCQQQETEGWQSVAIRIDSFINQNPSSNLSFGTMKTFRAAFLSTTYNSQPVLLFYQSIAADRDPRSLSSPMKAAMTTSSALETDP